MIVWSNINYQSKSSIINHRSAIINQKSSISLDLNLNLKSKINPMQHLHIPAHPHPHYIPVGQIIRIESCSNYSKVYSTGMVRPILASKVLQWFQDRLPTDDFARVHRSHLVNRQFITQVTSDDLHKALLLRNGEEIPVSRRKQGAVG